MADLDRAVLLQPGGALGAFLPRIALTPQLESTLVMGRLDLKPGVSIDDSKHISRRHIMFTTQSNGCMYLRSLARQAGLVRVNGKAVPTDADVKINVSDEITLLPSKIFCYTLVNMEPKLPSTLTSASSTAMQPESAQNATDKLTLSEGVASDYPPLKQRKIRILTSPNGDADGEEGEQIGEKAKGELKILIAGHSVRTAALAAAAAMSTSTSIPSSSTPSAVLPTSSLLGKKKRRILQDDLECSICFEWLALTHTTPCGHSFCYECMLDVWDAANKPAPTLSTAQNALSSRSSVQGMSNAITPISTSSQTVKCPQCNQPFHILQSIHNRIADTIIQNLMCPEDTASTYVAENTELSEWMERGEHGRQIKAAKEAAALTAMVPVAASHNTTVTRTFSESTIRPGTAPQPGRTSIHPRARRRNARQQNAMQSVEQQHRSVYRLSQPNIPVVGVFEHAAVIGNNGYVAGEQSVVLPQQTRIRPASLLNTAIPSSHHTTAATFVHTSNTTRLGSFNPQFITPNISTASTVIPVVEILGNEGRAHSTNLVQPTAAFPLLKRTNTNTDVSGTVIDLT